MLPPAPPKPKAKAVSLAELTGRAHPLALENMNRVHVGMTFEQVNRALGKEGDMFSSGNVESDIYRWSDDTGASFVGKFEDGKLVRKSMYMPEGLNLPDAEEAQGDELLSKMLYEKVQPGMTLEEIQGLLKVNRRVVSESDTKVAMYEWVDRKGSNFFARFEDGRMTRKTGFHVAPMKEEKKSPSTAEEDKAVTADDGSNTDPVPADIPPATSQAPVEETMAEEEPHKEDVPTETAAERPKVAVVGGGKNETARSYRPKAKFPEYTWQFRRGNYEVRVTNTADMEVKVGLRSGKYGKDVEIKPGRSASIDVEQGTYTLYFQYEDDPQNVYTGESFTIDAMRIADVEIQVFNEAYDIGTLNRGSGQ
jgi:hypothetical protein